MTCGKWLFAQNMLARLCRSFHPLQVIAVGERYVHRIDIGIRQHIECCDERVVIISTKQHRGTTTISRDLNSFVR